MKAGIETLSVTTMVPKGKLPRLPFLELKNAILGKRYELSIVFTTPAHSRRLNRTHRGKDKPANVLSFALSPRSGELVLCQSTARKEAPAFGMSERRFLSYLLIHGMLHLKGFAHGSTMENKEELFLKKFSL